MSDRYDLDLTTPLVTTTRRYLQQEPNERISVDENLRDLCVRLEVLLAQLLRSDERWGRYKSTDGIMPCTAKRVSSTELELTGLVIWMADSAKREWVEPLFATIRISDASPVALDYKLFFGNAELGLGKRSYGSSQDFPQVPVAAWVFEFDSPRL